MHTHSTLQVMHFAWSVPWLTFCFSCVKLDASFCSPFIRDFLLQPPKHIESFGSITGYYIGYKVVASDKPYTFKTLEAHAHSKLEAIVSSLKKSTMYTFSVQAFNSKGAGPSSSEVTGKTLDKDPPSPPRLAISSVAATSVSLSWNLPEDSSPVNGKIMRWWSDALLDVSGSSPFHDNAAFRFSLSLSLSLVCSAAVVGSTHIQTWMMLGLIDQISSSHSILTEDIKKG